jgi:hypothetical protein
MVTNKDYAQLGIRGMQVNLCQSFQYDMNPLA